MVRTKHLRLLSAFLIGLSSFSCADVKPEAELPEEGSGDLGHYFQSVRFPTSTPSSHKSSTVINLDLDIIFEDVPQGKSKTPLRISHWDRIVSMLKRKGSSASPMDTLMQLCHWYTTTQKDTHNMKDLAHTINVLRRKGFSVDMCEKINGNEGDEDDDDGDDKDGLMEGSGEKLHSAEEGSGVIDEGIGAHKDVISKPPLLVTIHKESMEPSNTDSMMLSKDLRGMLNKKNFYALSRVDKRKLRRMFFNNGEISPELLCEVYSLPDYWKHESNKQDMFRLVAVFGLSQEKCRSLHDKKVNPEDKSKSPTNDGEKIPGGSGHTEDGQSEGVDAPPPHGPITHVSTAPHRESTDIDITFDHQKKPNTKGSNSGNSLPPQSEIPELEIPIRLEVDQEIPKGSLDGAGKEGEDTAHMSDNEDNNDDDDSEDDNGNDDDGDDDDYYDNNEKEVGNRGQEYHLNRGNVKHHTQLRLKSRNHPFKAVTIASVVGAIALCLVGCILLLVVLIRTGRLRRTCRRPISPKDKIKLITEGYSGVYGQTTTMIGVDARLQNSPYMSYPEDKVPLVHHAFV